MTIYSEVKLFIEQNQAKYERLVQKTVNVLDQIKDTLGPNVIKYIYTRADKQETGSYLKSNQKIARALTVLRSSGQENAKPIDVQDIAGATIVVCYVDYIDVVSTEIKTRAADFATVVSEKNINRNGYFAKHIIIKGRLASFRNLYCEIQIKTMLHDAWGTKTHDLTYKSGGYTDSALKTIMEQFGENLQLIEQQSVLLRDSIRQKWSVERTRRQVARQSMLIALNYVFPNAIEPVEKPEYKEIKDRLAQQDTAANWRQIESDIYEYRSAGKITSAESLFLICLLAAEVREDDCLLIAYDVLRETANYVDISCGGAYIYPLAMSALGDLEGAIDITEIMIQKLENLPNETEEAKMELERLYFNYANFLVERAVFSGGLTGDAAKALEGKVLTLMDKAQRLEKEDSSAFADLRGMLRVATAERSSEIIEALHLIENGFHESNADDREIARAYYELNRRAAWRRILELEAKSEPS